MVKLLTNQIQEMYQEIYSCMASSIDSVSINTSLLLALKLNLSNVETYEYIALLPSKYKFAPHRYYLSATWTPHSVPVIVGSLTWD